LPAHGVIDLLPDASLPLGLIEEVCAGAGSARCRRRLLPAAAVLIFVLGCALFYGEGYGGVARKLAGWLAPLAGPGGWHLPGTGALARARRRLGPLPVEALFGRLAGPLAAPGTPGAYGFGRLLVSLDGTMLDVPFTPANVAAFGPPPGGGGRGGWPQVRLVTLAACGSRGILAAVFGGRAAACSSEQDLARVIAAGGRLRRGMLVIADRNFCGHPVVAALAGTGAGVLIRATSGQRFPVVQALADGSCLSVLADPAAARRRHHRNAMRRARGSALPREPATLEGIPIRVAEADITITPGGGRPRTERCRLITTILDHRQAPATAIAACYAQRWESETGYREIKVFTRGPGRVLRSKDPAGIAQEIWALLCACQITHTARASAAAARGLDPDRISYTITLRAIRRALTTASTATSIASEALTRLLPPRRHRGYPRHKLTSTARRRDARGGLTGTIDYKITISPATQASDLPGP